MINIDNHLGRISISNDYLSTLIGHTVTSCFGVAGMNNGNAGQSIINAVDKIRQRTNKIDKGVLIRNEGDRLSIDLHITVTYGTNISAIVDSITNKVRYAVEEATDLTVIKVNVFVDGMTA